MTNFDHQKSVSVISDELKLELQHQISGVYFLLSATSILLPAAYIASATTTTYNHICLSSVLVSLMVDNEYDLVEDEKLT